MIEDSQEERLQELRSKAHRRAEAKSEYEYLNHYRKSKLAILMREYEKDGFKTTASQDREARADSTYEEILQGLKAACEEYERLDWELRISMKAADLWQTKQANKRHEMKQYGA